MVSARKTVMFKNTSHPDFDYDMEVLASLAPFPGYTECIHLKHDMESKLGAGIVSAIDRLRTLGFRIGSGMIDRDGPKNRKGLSYWIEPSSIEASRRRAGRYMEMVYG